MQVRFACTGAFKEGKLERAVTYLVSRAQVHCADRSLDGIGSNLQQEQQQQQGGAAASSQVPSALAAYTGASSLPEGTLDLDAQTGGEGTKAEKPITKMRR
jgi:hypothetical protein